jgi:hypothetical protein
VNVIGRTIPSSSKAQGKGYRIYSINTTLEWDKPVINFSPFENLDNTSIDYDPWQDPKITKEWDELESMGAYKPLEEKDFSIAKHIILNAGPPGSGKDTTSKLLGERMINFPSRPIRPGLERNGFRDEKDPDILSLFSEYGEEEDKYIGVLDTVFCRESLTHHINPETFEYYTTPYLIFKEAVESRENSGKPWIMGGFGLQQAVDFKARFRKLPPKERPTIILRWPLDEKWIDYWYEKDREGECIKRIDYHIQSMEKYLFLADYLIVLTEEFQPKEIRHYFTEATIQILQNK